MSQGAAKLAVMITASALDATFTASERQHGLALVDTARAVGITARDLRRLEAAGRIDRVSARVLRAPGSPRTDHQVVMAAVLDASPGAFASGRTSAAMWGVSGYRLFPVHAARARGVTGRRSSLAVLHEVRHLLPHHVTVLDDIPVLRPERTILDLCATEHPRRAARALDDMWRRRLLSGASMRALVDEIAIQGRGGVAVARSLLDERGDDYVPPASNLEARFASIVTEAGLPPMRRQVDSGGDRWVGRVDFRSEDAPLIVEIQSERYHSALTDKADDAARLAALRVAGFAVIEITEEQVWHRPHEVVGRVRAAYRSLDAG